MSGAETYPVERIGNGVYRVDTGERAEIVYVAGSAENRWAFWNGHVYNLTASQEHITASPAARKDSAQALSSPMPATVRSILVKPGAAVSKGDVLIVLEAMKMELPLRAEGNGTVRAIHCAEGELVQPDTVLIELNG